MQFTYQQRDNLLRGSQRNDPVHFQGFCVAFFILAGRLDKDRFVLMHPLWNY